MTNATSNAESVKTLCEKVPEDVRDQFIVQCQSAGADTPAANRCVSRIIQAIAAARFTSETPNLLSELPAQKVREIARLSSKLREVALSYRSLSMVAKAHVGPILSATVFSETGANRVSTADALRIVEAVAHNIELETEHNKRGASRPLDENVEHALRAATLLWRHATGNWPARTRSKADGEGESAFVRYVDKIAILIGDGSAFSDLFSGRKIIDCISRTRQEHEQNQG